MRLALTLPLIALLIAATPIYAQTQTAPQVAPQTEPQTEPQAVGEAVTFPDDAALTTFLDEAVMKRQFGALMQRMSGDTLTLTQVQQLTEQMRKGFVQDFDHVAVMRRAELENGFRQELRVYWGGNNYIYVFVLTHERESDVAVLNLGIHANPAPALAMF